ncbi:MAG: HNH endonuclease [Saprospiraceae bacterium]
MTQEIRKLVKERANYLCEYCLALSTFSFHPFPIDHIIPLSQNGTSDPDNLALACQHCNNCKYNKSADLDPLTGKVNPLFNPRLESWSDHFTWNEDFTLIIGTSAVGRTTVNCLKMNRQEAVNLRKALHHFGVHPPF